MQASRLVRLAGLVAVLAVVFLAVTQLLSYCGSQRNFPVSRTTPSEPVTSAPTTLPSVEVTGYQGQPLSRIAGQRETSIKGPQHVDRKTYRLHVDGLVDHPLSLTYADLLAFTPRFRKVVTLNCVLGWHATLLWEGFRVRDLLAKAGVKPGATVVIFHAHDGYTSSLPLDYFMKKDILLAYHHNGLPLDDEWGWPLQLVAEDKWGYKWVKWVDGIEVSSDTSYRGYWESRGYSQSGDLGKNYFGR